MSLLIKGVNMPRNNRDGDEVHYRIHSSNGLTVDRYTREVEE